MTILPRIRLVNYRREFPQAGPFAFRRWFSVNRHWGGKLVYISVRQYSLILDFRGPAWWREDGD